MSKIVMTIPQDKVVEKTFTGKDGDFTLKGILLAGKFVRLVCNKEFTLPTSGDIIGTPFARSYKSPKGEFQELAIWVDNAVHSGLPQ